MSTHGQQSSLLAESRSFIEDEGRNSQEIVSSPQKLLPKRSKKRRADGSLADHLPKQVQNPASRSMDGIQRSLPYTPEPAKPATDSAKETIEEQRLRRTIEEAERRMLGQELSQPTSSDVTAEKCTDQATKGEKENQNQNQKGGNDIGREGGRRKRASSFLEWEEPVLR
jgi:hypothetical protein